MKRVFAVLLVLCMLCGSALACDAWTTGDVLEVVNCKEYVTLRSGPSTETEAVDYIPLGVTVLHMGSTAEGFTEVMYLNNRGYVKNDYLKNRRIVCDGCESVELSEKELYNVNLFLTNFTEQGMLYPADIAEADGMADFELVEFAIQHIWYNRKDYLEWGEYFNGNNVRLSDEYIAPVCEKYFGRIPHLIHDVDYDMADNHYYWQETGGHVPMGFALLHSIADMGGGRYRVGFCVYGQGMEWDDDVYSMDERDLVHSHLEYFNGELNAYGTRYNPRGNAIINVNGGSLSDRSTWTLDRLVIDWEY